MALACRPGWCANVTSARSRAADSYLVTAAVRHKDVLVVGAGSAGSVVAERLSMDSVAW